MVGGDQRITPARDGETETMLPERELQFPPTIHRAHRRPFGIAPAPLLAALAAGMFVLAIVLFALGGLVAGIVFLALSCASVGLFVVAVGREPESQSARLASTAASRAHELISLMAVVLHAASSTGLELAKLWQRRQRLRVQLRRRLAPLGEAVHRDDLDRAAKLKAQARRLDEALGDADRCRSDALASLRQQIERARANTQSTQRLPVLEESPASDR